MEEKTATVRATAAPGREQIRRFVRELEAVYRPGPLAIDINEVCGRRCLHCTFHGWRTRRPLLTASDWERVIRQAAEMGVRVLTIAGREPFHPSSLDLLVHVLKVAREVHRFKSIGLVTDAHFVPFGVRALKEAALRLSYVDVSVDGLERTHEMIRGAGAWKDVEKAFGDGGLDDIAESVGISVTLTHVLLESDELAQLLRWAAAKGIHFANVSAMFPSRETPAELHLKAGDFERALDMAVEVRNEFPSLKVVFDLPPRAVPDICELARRRVVQLHDPQQDASGAVFVQGKGGIPVRVYGGMLGLGSVFRVTATGEVRFEYDASEQPPPWRSFDSVKTRSLSEIAHTALFGPGGLWEQKLLEATQLPDHILKCPAWPYHMRECPNGSAKVPT